MKRFVTLILALALTLPMGATVFAAEGTVIDQDDEGQTGSTSVEYSVAPAYMVTIPSSVEINGAPAQVIVEGVKVKYNQQVAVRLTGVNVTEENPDGDPSFQVKTAEGAVLPYTVTAGRNSVSKGGTVLTVDPADAKTDDGASGTIGISCALAQDQVIQYAGDYEGTVTFTVAVVNKTASGQ